MKQSERIYAALMESFPNAEVTVTDESEQHLGHAGYREGGESHFRVYLRDSQFAPMSRLARHRAVHAAIGPEIIGQIHALALDIES